MKTPVQHVVYRPDHLYCLKPSYGFNVPLMTHYVSPVSKCRNPVGLQGSRPPGRWISVSLNRWSRITSNPCLSRWQDYCHHPDNHCICRTLCLFAPRANEHPCWVSHSPLASHPSVSLLVISSPFWLFATPGLRSFPWLLTIQGGALYLDSLIVPNLHPRFLSLCVGVIASPLPMCERCVRKLCLACVHWACPLSTSPWWWGLNFPVGASGSYLASILIISFPIEYCVNLLFQNVICAILV